MSCEKCNDGIITFEYEGAVTDCPCDCKKHPIYKKVECIEKALDKFGEKLELILDYMTGLNAKTK